MAKNGGRRPGAGRPKGSKTAITRDSAQAVWARINAEEYWYEKLTSENEGISLKAGIHLDNRANGCPAQSVSVDDRRSKVLLRSPEREIPCQTDAIQ